MDKKEIIAYIKEKIIYENLELSEWGHELSDIKDDTSLISDDGLALDSVDLLDIFVAVQQKYGIELGNITKEMMEEHCRTPLTLAELVINNLGGN
ncbi:phosphopantetheine-binding protein [Photorhabdus temperata]|uniref:Phosphopantetheine-containing protein n=1 Tax=Photorhabdus temperata subsp. temperata Meg1 TaxID=1393735 RepID=A0A081RWI7_PHOTE|nr:phosphopantetheine-binding protein [Photorhabdus temperata]KER03040.1 phosphopantetheine-containing protein [Photorhabdus temperata subsp. temperata Meg1]MCT8347818.1 phosphopantetheine-binding protein [Photorhabdus temperata]